MDIFTQKKLKYSMRIYLVPLAAGLGRLMMQVIQVRIKIKTLIFPEISKTGRKLILRSFIKVVIII
jgi:hypothetical protein